MTSYERFRKKWFGTSEESTTNNNTYKDFLKKHGIYADVDQAYLDKFIEDSNAYLTSAQGELDSVNFNNYKDIYSSRNDTYSDLLRRSSIIRNWLGENESRFSAEDYKSIGDTLTSAEDSLKSVYNVFESMNSSNSQFKSELEYNEAMKAYNDENAYNNLLTKYDKSKATEGLSKYYADKQTIADNLAAEEESKPWYVKLFENAYEAEASQTPIYWVKEAENYKSNPNDEWDQEELNAFGALYLEDPESAAKFAKDTNNRKNKKKEEEKLKEIATNATESVWSGARDTLLSVFAAGFGGVVDTLDDLAHQAAGVEITADGYISPFEWSQAVTGAVSNSLNEWSGTLDESIPVIGGAGLGDLYQLGVSRVQSVISGKLLGSAGTLISYFGQAAAAGVDDALGRGASQEQALLYGAACGAFEGLFEMVGVEKLLSLKSGDGVKGFLKSILKQGFDEATEEGLTTLFSTIADVFIVSDHSNIDYAVSEYIAQGYSEAEAKKKAYLSALEDVAYDMLGGAISGIAGGSGVIGANKVLSNISASQNYGDRINTEQILSEAANVGNNQFVDNAINRYGQKGKLSGNTLNKLIKVIESGDRGKIASAVRSELERMGESGNVKAISEVVAKQIAGVELSRSEKSLISKSVHARDVLDTLNRDIISQQSGIQNWEDSSDADELARNMYDTEWTKDIGTQRINADIYNRNSDKTSIGPENKHKINIIPPDDENKEEESATTGKDAASVGANFKKIASFDNGDMSIELADGSVVNSTELDLGESGIGLVYQAAKDMSSRVGGFNIDTANVFVRGYNAESGQSAGEYINGWISAYKFGAQNTPSSALVSNEVTSKLTEEQRKAAYNFGRAFGNEKIVNTVSKKESKISKTDSKKKKGRVIFDGEKYGKTLSERQRASLKSLNFLAKALGVDIYVEKLAKDENGWYDPGDRSIHIDINSGVDGEALLLNTTSHELSHDIRAVLPESFNTLADAVFEEYNKKFGEHTMEDLIANKLAFLKEKGDIIEDMTEEEAYDLAYEEVICDCLETMLVDSDAMTALSEKIYAKDKTLWQRIKDFFARLVERIKAAYADVVPDSEEGQRFRDLGEGAERIKKLWEEAIVELSEVDKTTSEGKVKHSYSSIAYSFFGDDNVSIKDMESGAYKDTEGYKQYVEKCLNNMRQSVEGFSEKSALEEIRDSIDGIVKVAVAMKKAGYDILDTEGGRNTRDSKKRLLFSSLEPNSDYFTSSDISTICDKRINFAEIYDEIVRREEALDVPKDKRFFNNIDNYFVLHKILADKGLTQPCRECYVESMRKNLDPMANAFIELMQEKDPDNKANKQLYQPSGKNKGELKTNNAKLREKLLETIEREHYDITADDLTIEILTTAKGLAQLKMQAPLIYEAFNSFYGQSKPKMPKEATPFRFGELTALLTDDKGKIKTGLIKQIMSTGGFRLQSYSDFQIQNFADVLQVIFEAGTLGLNGHAYTKVPAFLDATKGTNLKRNISIFMYNDNGEWRIDRNDSFPYELEKIYDIVDADESGNTGIIAVVQNEDMAAFIMANDNIGYFIPFHKSGVKMGVVRETVVKEGGREIKGYSGIKDHTRQQTEVWAKNTADHKANTKVQKGINIYEFWDFDNVDNLSKEGLIEKNVKAYIDACEEAGYLPKFREYVMNNSKVLNAVLNYSKKLGFVSQDATIDDISFEYKGYKIPYGYYKCLGDFGMFTPDGEASPIERLSLKDYNFDEAEAFFSKAETLRRNEILQQIANGEERDRYRTGDKKNMTTAEIAEEVQAKRSQVVDEVVSGEYKNKKYSHKASEKSDYAADAKITADMTEEERYEMLKDKKITAPFYEGEVDLLIVEEIESKKHQYAKDAIVAIAEKLEILEERINFDDVDVEITISRRNIGESISQKATPAQIAKLLPVLPDVAKDSILTERHKNRYFHDTDTIYFDELVGAYIDGNELVPIRFGLKHSRTGNTTLYVVVDQNKVAIENLDEIKNDTGHQDASSGSSPGLSNLRRRATYSLSQIIRFVNSKDLLKYIPNQMLNKQQLESKWVGIAESVAHTNNKNDNHYRNALARGDIRSAKQIVSTAAKEADVYTDERGKPIDLYHGTPNFGFTQFKEGIIFTTSNPTIAAGYTANKGWGRVRQISQKYKRDDGSLDTLIENAKNILETDLHQITSKEQKAIRDEIKAQADELAERINDAWTSEAVDALGTDLDYDALTYVLTLAGTISENIDEIGNYYSVSDLEHDIDLFDRHYSEVKEYFADHREELNGTPAQDMYELIMGYDLGDFAIDARYKLLRSLDDSVLVNERGVLSSQDRVRDDIEKMKDVGAYHLYGVKGDNPLVIDAQNKSWLDIRVEGWEDRRYSTEQVAKIAKEKGYTSVVIKNVYDMSGNEYAVNIPSDIYIFFDSNQLKSADIITYDDNGRIVPISERFNPKNSDIRYQHRATNGMKPRTLLANALSRAVTEKEKNLLQTYKDNLDMLNAEQDNLDEIMSEIDEIRYKKSLSILGEEMSVDTFKRRAMAKAKKNGINADDVQFKLDRSNSKYIAYAVGHGTILEADKTFRSAEESAKLKELWGKAKTISDRIADYDKELLRLQAIKPIKAVMKREKEQAVKKAEDKGRELRNTAVAKVRERSGKSEERYAIKALKEKFIKMLTSPTERQYVPAPLISAMVDVCQIIDTDTDLYKKDGSINKAQQARNEQMQKLIALRDEYAKLGKDPDPMYSGEFDAEVLAYLDDLRTDYAGKPLSEMTLAELKDFRLTLRAVEETLRDARKLIGWGEADLVYDAGDAIIDGQREITKKRNGKGESTAKAAFLDNSLSPLRNIKRMADYDSDSPLVKLFREIELGVRRRNKFAMDAYKNFDALTTGDNAKRYEDAIYKPHGKKYIDKEGRTFRVSKMEKMQAIMSYDRELSNSKLHHVSEGGFTFADLDLLNKGKLADAIDPKNAHSVTFGAVIAEEFRSELADDAWAQDYMAASAQFFNDTAKKAVNDANMQLKHRIIATGSNYIPYEVNKDYVVREITSENDIQQTISGYGMLKDLKDGATQPLIITGLNNVLERHIDQVGNIHGLAVPIRNFNKIWNVKSSDGSTTVQEAIGRNWGKRGKQVMIQAVKDVQGSRISHRSDIERKLKSNVIGALFMLNGSVVTKQIGSLFTATAKMRWRDPASMIANLLYTMAKHKKIEAEVDKYTASAWMRRQGMSDAEMHTLATEAKKKGLTRLMSKIPTALNPTKWISGMDSMVALSLWKYAKEDVAKKTGLEGEELLKAAAEYYDDIIEHTQSMSDALHRPEIQKRDDLLADALGTFKTDLYQGAGLIRDALGEFKANKNKENAGALARAITGNVMSALWGSLMTSLFALLRYKVNRYRDDEDDEIDAESWLAVQGGDVLSDLIGYAVPLLGGELADIVMAIINGDQVDGFDNMVLDGLNSLVDSISGIANAVKEGEMPSKAAFKKYITSICSAFGIPANNVTRLLDAIYLHAQDIANGEFFSFEAGLTSPNSTRLYNAYIEGDADKIKKASRPYKTDSELHSAIRKALREHDPRIKEAAEAKHRGDIGKHNKIAEAIIAEGIFEKKDIVAAINAETNEIKRGETTESESTEDDEVTSINSASDINVAFDRGETSLAKEIISDLVDTKVANGMTEKEAKASLRSSMTSYWKPLYKQAYKSGNNSEMVRIRKILYSSGLYGTADDVVKAAQNWLKD